MFTDQLLLVPYNYAILGVFLTHAQTTFRYKSLLPRRGTVLAGNCLPWYIKRVSRTGLHTRTPSKIYADPYLQRQIIGNMGNLLRQATMCMTLVIND